MGRLEGKVAIVTGGGSGIGAATCVRLAEDGAIVAVTDVNLTSGKQIAAEIKQRGFKATFVPIDVASEESIEQGVAKIAAEFGRIDVLVNNAAVFIFRGIEASVADWQRVLAVNVIGPALMAKHVVPHMKKQGGGAIVNVASQSSFIAQPKFVTYNSSKAALANMTRCMALDLAPDNIRVNSVCPGTIWTPQVERMARDLGMDRKAADSHPDFGGMHFIPRLGEPREIANAILFLASDEASFITAENLMVDGGATAR